MKFCPNCGASVEDNASYCPNCGTFLSENKPTASCPRTYLVLSVISTFLFCLPLGLVGLLNSIEVSNDYRSGLYEQALRASSRAKRFSIAAIIVGCVWIIAWCAIIVWCFSCGYDFDDVISSI